MFIFLYLVRLNIDCSNKRGFQNNRMVLHERIDRVLAGERRGDTCRNSTSHRIQHGEFGICNSISIVTHLSITVVDALEVAA